MKVLQWGSVMALSLSTIAVAAVKDLTPREIYEQASPAVVMVMGHPDHGKGSGGTGAIIRSDGYVLTNAHVVIDDHTGKPFPRLSVFLKPARVTGDSNVDLSRRVRGIVTAFSQQLDLALVKLEGVTEPLPVVALDSSERTRIGDRVVAIGHPEQGGLWTLTTGVISAEVDNFNGVKGKHVFQTETGLNRGNSGGPLLDTEGRMVGVNTAIARVASDGLPITSISFSLKSSVANHWMMEQGLKGQPRVLTPAPISQTKAASDVPAPLPPPQPRQEPFQRPLVVPPPSGPVKPPVAGPPARPYNLDQLVSERAKAESDLEGMMIEMRERMKGR